MICMTIDLWPIVDRTQLVRSFRPGELASKEAPFRTLRAHGWATSGVSVSVRKGSHAGGRFTLFSIFNMDAARCARQGDREGAAALTELAAQVEASRDFVRLCGLFSGKSSAFVSRAVEGDVSESSEPELFGVLRRLARQTGRLRARCSVATPGTMMIGKISETRADSLILKTADGVSTAIPRELAQGVHREHVDDCLALFFEKLDRHQVIFSAIPAVNSSPPPGATFSPFGRSAAVHQLSAEDARLLSGTPARLRVMVPVTIHA